MSSAGPRPRSPSAKGGLPGRASNRRSEIEAARLQDQNLELQENVVRLNADLAARMRFQRRAQTDGDVAQAQAQARSSTLQEERDDALARCTSLQGSFDEKLRVERAERGGLAGKVRELEADLGLEQQLAAQLQEELQAAREGDEARRRELDRASHGASARAFLRATPCSLRRSRRVVQIPQWPIRHDARRRLERASRAAGGQRGRRGRGRRRE